MSCADIFGRFWSDLVAFKHVLVGFGLDFGRFWLAFWLAHSVFSRNNTDSRPDNSGSYGGLWRDLVGFGRFWSPSIVPEAVYQGCIKWHDCFRQWPFGFIENLLRFY